MPQKNQIQHLIETVRQSMTAVAAKE